MSAGPVTSKSPNEFYIYYLSQEIITFYHIFVRKQSQYDPYPYEDLQRAVNDAFSGCEATVIKPPHLPTEQQKEGLTSVKRWAEIGSGSSNEDYQVNLFFNPKENDGGFIDCFDGKLTDWMEKYDKSQEEKGNMTLLYTLLFLAGFALVLGGIIFLCLRCKKNREDRLSESGQSLFSKQSDDEGDEVESQEVFVGPEYTGKDVTELSQLGARNGGRGGGYQVL